MSDLRLSLERQLEEARQRGKVHWSAKEVVDRPLVLGNLVGRIRYTPSFVYRRLHYLSDGPTEACSLCPSERNDHHSLRLPRSGLERFHDLFVVRHNNFPYADRQVVLVATEHIQKLTVEHFEVIVQFMQVSGLSTAALQMAGSGATVPNHAHVNAMGEAMPIFALPTRVVARSHGVSLELAPDYPGALYVLTGGAIHNRCQLTAIIANGLDESRIPYNMFIRPPGDIYVVPRRQEFSPSLRRKVGSMEVTALHVADALDAAVCDEQALQHAMRARWLEITSSQYMAALNETVCSKQSGRLVQELFANAHAMMACP